MPLDERPGLVAALAYADVEAATGARDPASGGAGIGGRRGRELLPADRSQSSSALAAGDTPIACRSAAST
jgi:hypothetical protein